MSDQDNKNIEQIGEEGKAAESAAEESREIAEDAVIPEPVASPPPPPPPAAAPAPGKGRSGVAWLALLLVLALAGAVAWLVMQAQQREAELVDRLAAVESVAGGREDALNQMGLQLKEQLQSSVAAREAGEQRQLAMIRAMEEETVALRAELARFSATDRDSWLLAETEYLLRLANQRLIMAGDTDSAQVLLASADKILREVDDVSLHPARAAVAADLADVRAVPQVDVEGIYLRLSALVEQAGKLVIFQMPEQEPRAEEEPAEDWQGRLEQGYRSALYKLSDYIVIRRRDVPVDTLMDPQWEGLVRQNLRMLLEQAQVALLSGSQTLYEESLQRSRHWVAEFFQSDEAAARAMDAEIDQLSSLDIAVKVPDIARSLQALDEAVKRRLQQGGGE